MVAHFWKKVKMGSASALVASSLMFVPASINQAFADNDGLVQSNVDIQCISDQKTVGDEGEISYHILYHNVSNKNGSHEWIKVKVPNGLEADLEKCDGAQWDSANRMLMWNLKEGGKGAEVIHFNLKVKKGVAKGTEHEIYCEFERDGQVVKRSPSVLVRSGTQIDQPFFTGYPDGMFHPSRSLTRAEAASVVARILNLTDGNRSRVYTDVPGDHWASSTINKVTNAGYMGGYQDGSFHPDAPITRAELVALVLRIRGVHDIPIEAFNDEKGHWAEHIIGTAKALNWVHGVGEGRFDADAPVERQVAAVWLDIAQFRGPLTDGITQVIQHYPDVSPSAWSYHWVEEASKVAHEAAFGSDGMEHLIQYRPDQTENF